MLLNLCAIIWLSYTENNIHIYIYIYINTGVGCNVTNSAQYYGNRARISLESMKHYVFITLQYTDCFRFPFISTGVL